MTYFDKRNPILNIFSLVSAFSQKNKTYKMGHCASVRVHVCMHLCACMCACVHGCMCVCVYVCGKFWSPLTISKPVIRLIQNLGYIQYRTGTLQQHISRFLILKIVAGRNYELIFSPFN